MDVINEINRCLNCKKPLCMTGCPIGHDIRDYIQAAKVDLQQARAIIDQKNVLAGFCSQLCPYDLQCQGACVLNRAKKPIQIGAIEQYIVNNSTRTITYPKVNAKVLIIGGGVSGVAFAYLAMNHQMDVTIYEKEDHLGGIPIHGIPDFRFDKTRYKEYIQEVLDYATIKYNYSLGIDYNLIDVINQFDYIYLACGSDTPNKLQIVGEDLENVILAHDFLMDFNNSKIDLTSKEVLVVGAGNVSMDVARASLRANANKVTVVYRRTLQESPASIYEIEEAIAEGVEFKMLNSPVKVNGASIFESLVVEKMELKEDPNGGRAYPVGTNIFETIKGDYLIAAIGQGVGPEIMSDELLTFTKRNKIDSETQTNPKLLFGGDVVRGPSSVAYAISDAYKAFNQMLEKL